MSPAGRHTVTLTGHSSSPPQELNTLRSQCGRLYGYDWISIPLVYTQVRRDPPHLSPCCVPCCSHAPLTPTADPQIREICLDPPIPTDARSSAAQPQPRPTPPAQPSCFYRKTHGPGVTNHNSYTENTGTRSLPSMKQVPPPQQSGALPAELLQRLSWSRATSESCPHLLGSLISPHKPGRRFGTNLLLCLPQSSCSDNTDGLRHDTGTASAGG